MIFILAARHRETQEVAAWIIEREGLWTAMKNRGDIEAPPTLSPEWIMGCDIALMEPGTKYTGDIWDEIHRANQQREVEGDAEWPSAEEAGRRLSEGIKLGGITLGDAEDRPFGDALTFEENQVAEDLAAGEGLEDEMDELDDDSIED